MAKKTDKVDKFINNDLKSYCDFFEKNNLSELKIDSDEIEISLKKETLQTQSVSAPITNAPSKLKTTEKKSEEEPKEIYKEVKSPIVGTFYQSLAPGEPACVNIGDKVNKSSVVCIIESMKVMNQIKSEVAGEIADILVKDGDNVKVGQVIMLVK